MDFMAFINLTDQASGRTVRVNVETIASYAASSGGGSYVVRAPQSLMVEETPEQIDAKILGACGQAVAFA